MKVLMGLMAFRVMAASLAHSRLGPKTTARLVLVILFWSLLAETCGEKPEGCSRCQKPCLHTQQSAAVEQHGWQLLFPPPPPPGEQQRLRLKSHLHQEGSEETKHLVVLLRQRPKDLQRCLHSLALINVYEERGPRLQGPRAGLVQEALT